MYPATLGKFVDPKVTTSHFHLREGDTVADFGAGSGHYMKPLTDAVGKSGRVYLCEIQKNLVDTLGFKAREARLTNVYPVWCDVEAPNGSKLKENSLDGALISNVLFQFSDKVAALKEIHRVLRQGGKLFVIDWTDSFGNLGPRPEDVVREGDAKTLVESVGYVYEHSFPAGDQHYGLMFRKK